MRLTYRPGTRTGLLVAAAVLAPVLSGLAAGCSSSTPAYCTDAANLKTSVSNLGNVDVAKNGLGSLQTALTSVTSNAQNVRRRRGVGIRAADHGTAKLAVRPAVRDHSAKSQPSVTAATAVASSVTQVKSSASALQSAVSASGKC